MRASLLLGLAVTAQAALPTIETYGNKFYDANGNQFFMKGKSKTVVRVRLGRFPRCGS
jgi:hypothetical protein